MEKIIMTNPFITESNKEQLVRWYFQMLADRLGEHAELHVKEGRPIEEDSSYLVQKRLVFKSKV